MTKQRQKKRTPNNFGKRLSEALERSGITQAELASRTGIAESTISRWFTKSSPQPRTVRAVAELIGVRYEWLQTGEGEMSTSQPRPEHSVESRSTKELPANQFGEWTSSMANLEQFVREVISRMSATELAEIVEKTLADDSKSNQERLSQGQFLLTELRTKLKFQSQTQSQTQPKLQ